MLVVKVQVRVKPGQAEAFKSATRRNARASLGEPGVARFDILQQQDDPDRFLLIESYRDTDAPARHKETAHYAEWRDAVAEMMAEPRASVRYQNIFPGDEDW